VGEWCGPLVRYRSGSASPASSQPLMTAMTSRWGDVSEEPPTAPGRKRQMMGGTGLASGLEESQGRWDC